MVIQGNAGQSLMKPDLIVVFRTDASLQMGTGHLMRCLTLADALTEQGAECHFICRQHFGHLNEHVRRKGYLVHELSFAALDTTHPSEDIGDLLAHADWLGVAQEVDANECAGILHDLRADWLIVDHYALDTRWESVLKQYCRKLMVIDDLADRAHQCELLLDQTFGRSADDYKNRIPANSTLLCGSRYSLLRPEFATLRPYSLARRETPCIERVLITMGGVDKDNATGRILAALGSCELPNNSHITVVMGATAPWLTEVNEQAAKLPWTTNVMVGVSDMAKIMAESDLAIGAAGATTWERCCLGLPTIMVVLANNQKTAAALLEEAHAVRMLCMGNDLPAELKRIVSEMLLDKQQMKTMTECARVVTDGTGCQAVVGTLQRMISE